MKKPVIIISGLLILTLFTIAEVWQYPVWLSLTSFTRKQQILAEEDPAIFLEKVNQANLPGNKAQSLQGVIRLIDDNGETEKELEKTAFTWLFTSDHFAYTIDSITVIQEPGISLMINHSLKNMYLSSVAPASENYTIQSVLKTLQEEHAHVQVSTDGQYKMLTIDSLLRPDIQGYKIFVDPDSYEIRKVLIGMVRLNSLVDAPKISANNADNPGLNTYTYYLEISYTEKKFIDMGAIPAINNFILWSNRKDFEGKLQPAYHDYELINDLLPEPISTEPE